MAKRKQPEATAYEADVTGLHIRVDWDGEQTTVELFSGGPGQQQAQAVSVASGAWQAAPALYRTAHGLVLVVEGADATAGVTIGHGSLAVLPFAPPVKGAEKIALEPARARKPGPRPATALRGGAQAQAQVQGQTSAAGFAPLRMKDMEPMRMGDMEMNMGGGGMEMRMGDMRLSAGAGAGAGAVDPHRATTRFCGACGADAEAADRFCTKCGKKLGG